MEVACQKTANDGGRLSPTILTLPRGTFVHWLLYNLSGQTNIGLVENVPTSENLKAGGIFRGKNDFGKDWVRRSLVHRLERIATSSRFMRSMATCL